ncbi:MAG: glycosyltransferase family 4 protein [Cyanobacteria bacterium J06642_2]
MKRNVLHLVGDRNVGGIGSTLELIDTSVLQETYAFAYLETDGRISHAAKIAKAVATADVVAIHFAIRTAVLPTLALIRGLSWIYGYRTILVEHHYSEHFQLVGASRPRQLQRALAVASRLVERTIAVSPTQSRWLARFVPQDRLSTIASCSDLNAYLAVPRRLAERNRLVVATFGRHVLPWKGFDVLIEAASYLQDLPIEIQIGGRGPDTETLMRMAEGKSNVKVVGFIDNLIEFLSDADLVVIPSRWEAWGITCTEAKAASKPVIVSDVDGLSDQFAGCGLAVPPGDAEALAQTLRYACTEVSREELHAWGKAGRDSVQLATDNYIRQWRDVLQANSSDRVVSPFSVATQSSAIASLDRQGW